MPYLGADCLLLYCLRRLPTGAGPRPVVLGTRLEDVLEAARDVRLLDGFALLLRSHD